MNGSSVLSKRFADASDVITIVNEWNGEEVDEDHLRNGTQIRNVSCCYNRKVAMLALGEPDLCFRFNCSSYLDLQLNSFLTDARHDSHHFAVVDVGDIVRLQVPRDVLTVDPEDRCVRWLVELFSAHGDRGTTSDSNQARFVSIVRHPDLSSSDFNHQCTVYVRSQSLGLFELVYQFQI